MQFEERAAPAHAALQRLQIMADAAPVMIWMSGPDKQTSYFNKTWLEFTGRTLTEELATGWSEILHPDDVERCLTTYSEAFDARRSFEMECRQRRYDGEWRIVLERANPMYAPDGAFLGYIAACLDVTERVRAAARRERLFIESIRDYAIFSLTTDGRVANWNVGAERLKGYRADEIVGQHFSRFFPTDDVQQGKPDKLLLTAATDGRVEDLGWRVRKDGVPFWANVVMTAIRDDTGQLQGFTKVTRDMTERKQIEDELVQRAQELARLSADQLAALEHVERLREQRDAIERERLLEDERKRIARDLYDNVEQAFFAIGLAASTASTEIPDCEAGGRLTLALDRVNRLATDGVRQLREAIFALNRADVRDRRLVPSLRRLADDFHRRTGIEADVVVSGSRRRLPTAVAEALYAAAREALSNVERHSMARAAVLGLHICRREVMLTIQDDGNGALPVPIEPLAGRATRFGLRSIGERVLGLNGSFDAGPNPDGGFLVRTRLPLDDDSAA